MTLFGEPGIELSKSRVALTSEDTHGLSIEMVFATVRKRERKRALVDKNMYKKVWKR